MSVTKSTFQISMWIIILAGLIISCNYYPEDHIILEVISSQKDVDTKADTQNDIYQTDYDVTQRMAELYVSSNKENPPIVSIEPYVIDNFTCFYIINFEKGFMVVSADSRLQPVLAENDQETLDVSKLDNEGMKVWLEDTADRIKVLKENNLKTKQDYSAFWSSFASRENDSNIHTRSIDPNQDSVWIKVVDMNSYLFNIVVDVDHLLLTKWGNKDPWNLGMPKDTTHRDCDAGSEAVAAAQILYYYHNKTGIPSGLWHQLSIASKTYYPSFYGTVVTIHLSKSDYNVSSSRWGQMPLTDSGSNISYVIDLLLDLGERLTMYYNYNTTKSYTIGTPYNQCGISYSQDYYSFYTVEGNIMLGDPVIVSSESGNNFPLSYHNWIIDGCKDYTVKNVTTSTYYHIAIEDAINYMFVSMYSNDDMLYLFPNAYDGMQTAQISYEDRKFLRMNWGSNGNGDDGLYGILDSSDWVNGSNQNFTYTRTIFYNLSTSQLY